MGFIANVNEYMSVDECKDGGLYRLYARNFSLGVYSLQKQGFTGIRQKFTMEFLDLEYHWDTGNPYGTAKPIEFLEMCLIDLEDKISLFEWLKERNKHYL